MDHTLLLFDIDGTLLDTAGAGQQAMHTAGMRTFGEDFSFDGVRFSGRLDPAIFADAAHLNDLDERPEHQQRFHEAYIEDLRELLVREADRVRALPGIHNLLAELRLRAEMHGDVMLGLLTGNYADAAPLKLRAADIDPEWFSITAFGNEAPTRPDLVALAMRRYTQTTNARPDPQRVIVLGDTPHDVKCARAHQCVSFAVATGRYNVEQLQAQRPDVVVADLSDPHPLRQCLATSAVR